MRSNEKSFFTEEILTCTIHKTASLLYGTRMTQMKRIFADFSVKKSVYIRKIRVICVLLLKT